MKFTPRVIILYAVSHYLNEAEFKNILLELKNENVKQNRKFLVVVKRHFDTDKFKDAPFIWQDIWLYNYLEYEIKSRWSRTGLVERYETQIVLPNEKTKRELLRLIV